MISAHERTLLTPPGISKPESRGRSGAPVRALIADDNPRFRLELRGLLELEGIQVVGEAGNGWEAVELTQDLNPDVILMDQNMPSLTGIDATRRIKEGRPHLRVIFLAAEEAWRQEALRAGAEGYFVKSECPTGLIGAICQPGLGRALEWQKENQAGRKSALRRVAVMLGGIAGVSLLVIASPMPVSSIPAVALVLVIFTLVAHLMGGV